MFKRLVEKSIPRFIALIPAFSQREKEEESLFKFYFLSLWERMPSLQ
jgi:hypothetical protein